MLLVTTDLPIKCYPALPRRTLGDWAATNSRELVTSRSAKKKKKKVCVEGADIHDCNG